MGPRYREPTRASRLKFFGAMGLVWLWAASHLWWWPDIGQDPCGAVACEDLRQLQFVAVYFVLLPMLPAAWLGIGAWRVWHHGESPPPGSWLVVRKRLYTGRIAVAIGALHALGAAACLASSAWLAVTFRVDQVLCLTAPCAC